MKAMRGATVLKGLRRRAVAVACAIALVASGVPAAAWADAGTSLAAGAARLEATAAGAAETDAPSAAASDEAAAGAAASAIAPMASAAWTGAVDVSWYKPAVTSYTLTTPEQVAGLAAIVNGTAKGIAADTFSNKTVTLGADLTLNAGAGKTVWTAIGDINTGMEHATSTTVYFDGTFDGAGHTVEGLYMPSSSENYGGYHAFFGALGPHAVVRELGIASGEVSGRVAAGIAAVSRVENLEEVPQIIGCFNKATVFGNGATSRGCAGIFAGENQNGSEGVGIGYRAAACIVDCYNLGRISGSGPTGGIAGTGSIRMYGCYNAAAITTTTGGTLHGSLMCDLFAPGSVTASKLMGNGEIANSYAYIGTDEHLYRILDADHTNNDPAYPSEDFMGAYYNDTAAFLDADQMDQGSAFLGSAFVDDNPQAPVNGNMPLLWWQAGKSKIDIAAATVDPVSNRRYTGSPVRPALTVRIADPDSYEPIELNAGSDYRVEYRDNTAIGRASATVYGVGRFTGSVAPVTFNIVKIDLSSCSIDPIAPQWFYGGEVRPAVCVRTSDDTLLAQGEDYQVSYAGNDRAGKATVTVTAVGTGASGSLSADFYLVGASDHLAGSGSEADPYLLSSKGDLQFLSRMVNTDQSAYIDASYRVTRDIDAGAADGNDLGIDPIGLNHHPFAGTFDGAGHTITLNMDASKISESLNFHPLIYDYLGLFSCTGSAETTTIKNLTIAGQVTSAGTAAAFIGSAVDAELVMDNCVNEARVRCDGGAGTAAAGFIGVAAGTKLSLTDCVNRGVVTSGGNASGLVVYLNGGTGEHRFLRCGNEGSVTASESAGGVIQHYGPSRYSSFVAENCYNAGDVTSYREDGGPAGGILGMDQSSSSNAVTDLTCTFIACCNTGNVSGGRHGGGIAGQVYTTPMDFKGCYNTGRVEDTGRLFGAGGICGAVAYKSAGWTFTSCYSAGTLTGVDPGAILGWAYAGSQVKIRNCYYLEALGSSASDKAGVGAYNEVKGVQEPVVVDTDAVALDEAAMKRAGAAGMAARLGSIFESDSGQDPLNGGYPVCYWQVAPSKIELSAATVDALRMNVPYTGSGITQDISARYAGTPLIEGVDFVADYTDNVVPGTASVTLTGIGRYQGSVTRTFTIVNGTLATCSVADVPAQWSTDTGACPSLVVTNQAGNVLAAGVDYEVAYSDNIGDGTAHARLTGIGHYSGASSTKTVAFAVVSADAPARGTGTQPDPYVIETAAQFAFMMAKVNAGDPDYQFAFYLLGSDIDLSPAAPELAGKPAIEPVGTAAHSFFGVLDGGGHAITLDLDEHRPYIGLFGVVRGASFKDIVLKGMVKQTVEASPSGGETLGCVGALVGYAFDSLRVEGCVNQASVSSNGSAVAGLVGIADSAGCTVTFSACANQGAVESSEYLAAGLLGDTRAAQLSVRGCSNAGSVKASDLAAGLVGRMGGSVEEATAATVSRSSNSGAIRGDYRSGGLVGCMYAYSRLALRNVFNTGAIASEQTAGRAAYMTTGAGSNGGLVGGVGSEGVLTVDRAYNAGAITSTDSTMGLGGLVGYVYSSAKSVRISDAYYAGAAKSVGNQKLASGVSDASAAVSADELKAAGFAAALGGEFAADATGANGGYPVLSASHSDLSRGVAAGQWAGVGRYRASAVSAATYTGEAIVPGVTVLDTESGAVLQAGSDYRVVCEDNVNVGTARARIDGLAGQSGAITTEFAIVPASLSDCTVGPIAVQPLEGAAVEPALSIVNERGVELVAGVDYEADYSANLQAGTARVDVRGIGNYTGTVGATFQIVKRESITGKAVISKIADQMHTGKKIEPPVTVTLGGVELVAGTDYAVTYSDNKKVGTAKVVVKGIGLYKGTAKATFAILRSNLAKAKVASVKARVYSGKQVCPRPVVRLGGKKLVLGRDYSLSYRNNVNAGTAKIIVKAAGPYRGKKTVKFKIVPAKTKISLAPKQRQPRRSALLSVRWTWVDGRSGERPYENDQAGLPSTGIGFDGAFDAVPHESGLQAAGLQAAGGLATMAGADDAYLSVYTQRGDDESTRMLAKAFSKAEVERLAAQNSGFRAALYWGHGSVKVASTSSFVEIEQLFSEAGVLDGYTADARVKAVDVGGSSPAEAPTKAELDACSWFYPAVTATEMSAEGGSQFKPVLALTYASGSIPEGTTAGAYASQLADPSQQNGGVKRFLWGVSPEQLATGEGAAGNRLWSNVASIVLVEPAPAAGTADAGGTTSAMPVKPVKASIAKAKFSKVKAQKYNKGKAVKPAVVVTYAGKKLKRGTDYKLTYKNNKKRGIATIIVKGKGSFTGKKTIPFKIK